MSDYKYACGCKLLDSGGHIFCSIHAKEPGKAPTQQEQQAIDRALWSEIGLAIGRIEAGIESIRGELLVKDGLLSYRTELMAKMDRLVTDNTASWLVVKERKEQMARLDERLGAIETCQEKHRLALESITRILEKITGVAQPKRKRERKGKRVARRTGK